MIYIIWGAPRCGKTYFATRWAIKNWTNKKRYKQIITNYPIYWKGSYTKVWEPSLIYQNISDSLTIQDEAYREVSSRNWKNFDQDMHTFYATNGHNGNDNLVIAQHPTRVDTIIREMTNEFLHVKKTRIPFTQIPLFFKVDSTLTEQAMALSATNDNAVDNVEIVIFNPWVARAYDTHYFRHDDAPPILMDWGEKMKQKKEATRAGFVRDPDRPGALKRGGRALSPAPGGAVPQRNAKEFMDALNIRWDNLINEMKGRKKTVDLTKIEKSH